jgi:hypothetical protein
MRSLGLLRTLAKLRGRDHVAHVDVDRKQTETAEAERRALAATLDRVRPLSPAHDAWLAPSTAAAAAWASTSNPKTFTRPLLLVKEAQPMPHLGGVQVLIALQRARVEHL